MQRYVATVQLKRVTDGDRTFWHWQSTFDMPRGREREFADLVGKGVYEGGFEGLQAYLVTAGRRAPARDGRPRRNDDGAGRGRTPSAAPRCCGISRSTHSRRVPARSHPPDRDRRQLHRCLRSRPGVSHDRAAGAARHGGRRRRRRRGRRRRACCPATASPTPVRRPAPTSASAPCRRTRSSCSRRRRRRDAAALMLKGMTAAYLLHRTHRVRSGETVLVHAARAASASSCVNGRRRSARASSAPCQRRQGARRARGGASSARRPRLSIRAPRRRHRRARRGRHLRRPRPAPRRGRISTRSRCAVTG